jgi:outer membrane cobalamin receptor
LKRSTYPYRYIYKNITNSLLTALLVTTGSTAFAKIETGYQLGQIVVNPDELSGSHFSISQEDFERSGASTLDEAIKFIPSLNVRNGADGTPRIDIRGLRTRQIKLLINGVPFNSANNGQFDPTLIPTFAIDKINLQAGSSSVLYGDGGMGGVLNIQTRSGFDGFKTGGKAELGNDHYWKTNAYAGYGDAENDFFFSAGVRERDAFSVADGFSSTINSNQPNYQDNGDDRNNSDYRRVNLIGSYHRQVTENLDLGVFLSHVDGEYGKPPTVFASSDPFSSKAKYERSEDQKGTTLQVGANYDFNHDWSGKLWFFNNQLDEDTAGYDDDNYQTIVKKNSFTQTDDTEIRGSHAQLNGLIGASETEIAFSLDHRQESLDSHQVKCNANTCNNASQYKITDVDREIRIRSYGVELTQPLPYDMTLVAGLGHHQLKKDSGRHESENSAQLSLSKAINDQSTIYATFGQKVDAPTISQLYDASSGNDALGFQRAKHYEVGIKNQWDRASLDIAVYHSRVYDFIEKDDNTNLNMNRQEMLFKGVDISGVIHPSDDLTVRMSLGLLDASDESNDAASSTLQYRPHSKLSIEAQYDISTAWTANASFQRVGEQEYFNKNDASVHEDLSAFDLLGFKLNYALPQRVGTVYIGANNLLDQDYSTSYGFPQAGRFFYTGIKLDWK